MANKCVVPPVGWYCTRDGGHEGPCAALPVYPKNKDLLFLTKPEVQDLIEFTKHTCVSPAYRFSIDTSGPMGYMIKFQCVCGAVATTCDMDSF